MRKVDKNEKRHDQYGEFRLMTAAEGYVMFRRKGAMACVMSIKEWDALARWPCTEVYAKLRVIK